MSHWDVDRLTEMSKAVDRFEVKMGGALDRNACVINIHADPLFMWAAERIKSFEYIGRSKYNKGFWGNPFSWKKWTLAKYQVANLKESLECYEEYLCSNNEMMDCIPDLQGKILGCFCAPPGTILTDSDPSICHGQILCKYVKLLC
jgi:hypothetical protein